MTKKKKHKLMLCLTLLLFDTTAYAQHTICSAGGMTSGNGYISFTIGQPFYITSEGNLGTISPGVQQVYIITQIETVVSEVLPLMKMNVYPNPTTNLLTLHIESDNVVANSFCYTLSDNNGRILQNQSIETSYIEIDMSNFLPSVYFINVYNGAKRIQSFKIVKVK